MEGPQQVYTCEFSRSISRGGEGAILTTRRPTSSAWGRSGDFQKLIEFYTNPDSTGDNAQLPDSTCVHYRYVKRIVQSDGALNLYIYIYIWILCLHSCVWKIQTYSVLLVECNHHAIDISRMKRMEKTGQVWSL